MGVSISAYSNLALVPDCPREGREHEDTHHEAYAYADFAYSLRGVPNHNQVFKTAWGDHEFVGGSCYVETGDTVSVRVFSSSYSGYGVFRRVLGSVAGLTNLEEFWGSIGGFDPEKVPFYELLNFADNEGAIGPDAAKSLVDDFDNPELEAKFRELAPDWVWEGWLGFKVGVRLASHNGLVIFA